jgi:hypothetical protein
MRIVSYFLTLLLLVLSSAVFADLQQLTDQLRTDHAALLDAEEDFHSRRERGSLNGTEASEYAGYIAGLHRRVAEDCLALAQFQSGSAIQGWKQIEDRFLTDRLCPEHVQIVRPAPIDQGAEQTRAEQIAALVAELNAGLGEFDEMLLREQERVKAAAPTQQPGGGAEGGAGGGGDDEAGEVAASTQSGAADADSETNGDSNTRMGGTTRGQSSGAQGGAGTARHVPTGQPPDVPDGSDDDVVARQLREAAEKETDPELKKKLWEEYKKYKQGTR